MLRGPSARLLALAILASLALTPVVQAQESGGSFGGSSWDEPAGGGGGGGGGGGSDWGGGGGSSPQVDYAQQQADDERARRESERQAEEAARIAAEAEAARIAAEAAERARKLALPPADRVAALAWPAAPAFPVVSSPRVTDVESELGYAPSTAASWASHTDASAIDAPTHEVVGSWNWLGAIPCGGIPTLLLVAFALLVTHRRAPGVVRAGPSNAPAMRISLAFDWTARAALQTELASMATRFDMRNRQGLTDAANAMVALLGPHASAVRYVSWELSTGDARSWFQRRANDLRARFRAELVRNESTTQAREYTAREDEGQGLVVVTVVVAHKAPITPPTAAFDLASLTAAITRIAPPRGAQTMALEVIWSPAAENDRMSSYELEKLYPELQRIAEGVGARQCAYCRGPFPTELGKCPSCGAPV